MILKNLLLLLLIYIVFPFQFVKGENLVYKVDIKDEIGPGVWRLAKKSFDDAYKEKADYILIEMNTYGGMVVYADSLRTMILNSPIPVWVFINNNAASAGALISIACDKIYMREGANIGAATVVNQAGEAMPDKYQSYMRSMIRSTAQAHGRDTIVQGRDTTYVWKRDPAIAEAMVDENLYVPGISDSGKIITFTPHEAMRYGYCDGIAGSVEDVLTQEGVSNYTIMEYKSTALDKVIGVLVNPVLQGILIMIIIGGLYFELQTPGVGFPLGAAVAACILYFAPLYLEGMVANWEIIVFILGIILLMLELFVIPGFGVAGIAGILCIFFSLITAGVGDISFEFLGEFMRLILRSVYVVIISSTLALVLCLWFGSRFLTSRRLAFALHASQKPEEGYVGVDMSIKEEVNKKGVTFTDLRPAGKILIEGEIYDAVADQGEFIVKNTSVKVIRFQAGQLYVIKDKEE